MEILNSVEFNTTFIAHLISAWFPAVVIFLIVPSSLYFSNKEGFHKTAAIIYMYLTGFVVCTVLISTAILLLPSRFWAANILFFFGAYMLVKDSLVPIKLKDFKNGVNRQNLLFIPEAQVIEILLAMVAILAAIICPISSWKYGAAGLVILLLLIELGILIKNKKELLPLNKKPSIKKHFEKAAAAKSQKGNVYHIVLDSYFGPSLLKYLQDSGSRPDAFEGFVLFGNNLANYNHTHPSVASFMTGSFYKSGSFKRFKENWLKTGLMDAFYQSGFNLWQYVNGTNWLYQNTENWEIAAEGKASTKEDLFSNFADILLLRLVPTFLRKKVYRYGEGYAGPFSIRFVPELLRKNRYNCLPLKSVELFKQLIADEEKRPPKGQYVHTHLYFPHGPFIMDAQGNLSDKADYHSHAHYAMVLLEEFLNKLKEQGKYHEATILVQSDHAIGINVGEGPMYSSPHVPKNIVNEARALLMIKRPGVSGVPFQISASPTQLIDIPATLTALNDIKMLLDEGRNVFEIPPDEHREIPFYLGYHTDKGDFGQAFFKGEFNHLAYDNLQGWKVYPGLEAVWE